MATPEAAWKHSHAVSGNDQDHGPGFYSRTPANIISGAKAAYTAGELVTATTDDTNYVANSDTVAPTTTRRQSHLFRFDIADPAAFATITNLVDFSHLVNGSPRVQKVRTYIWNADTLAWVQLAASNNANVPRAMTGPVSGPDFSPYVDGSDKLYVLIWDYEGTFRTGGGGCIHAAALVHTPSGAVPVADIRPGSLAYTFDIDGDGGELRAALVHEVTRHFAQPWEMVSIETAHGVAVVTDDHPIETELGELRADAVAVGDRVLNLAGEWVPVIGTAHATETCEVFDVQVRGPNVFLAGGVGVNVSPT